MNHVTHDQELTQYILEGMARAIWVHAFIVWATEVEPPPVLHGGTWDEAAPNNRSTRSASLLAAKALEEGIEQANPGVRSPLVEAFRQYDANAEYGDETEADHAYAFGGVVAMASIGLERFSSSIEIPTFTFELDDDGRAISWDGGMSWEGREHAPNPGGQWPSSDVQSLMFDVGRYTLRQAQRWAQDHGFRYGAVDTTARYHHLRQFQPKYGQPCRTIDMGHGIQAIVCATSNPPGKPLGIEVLVLEDDPKIQAGVARMVKQFLTGVHVIFADNVGAAIADLEVHQFGLVISDVHVLGALTGLDLFRHVQEKYPGLVDRFVFFTDDRRATDLHYRYVEKGAATADDLKRAVRAPAPGRGAPTALRTSPVVAGTPVGTGTPAALDLVGIAEAVNAVAPSIQESAGPSGRPMGRNDDKVFIAAVWRELHRRPGFRAMTLDQFKRRLLEANQQQLIDLARMDAQGDFDTDEIEESEIDDRGAHFHLIRDRSRQRMTRGVPMSPEIFARAVLDIAPKVPAGIGHDGRPTGRYGGRKVFVAGLWREAQRDLRFAGMTRAQFNQLLLQAQRGSLIDMARADLVGAMDPAEVADSEIASPMGLGAKAVFHFVVDPSYREPWERR